MSLESVTVPQDLNASNPAAGDVLTEGDNHLRIIKVAAKQFCWEHVGTSAVAGSLTISTYALFGAFEAGYDYHVTFEDLYKSSATSLDFRVTTGGGVEDSGSNYAHSGYLAAGAGGAGSSATNKINGNVVGGDAATETAHQEVTLLNPRGTTNPRHIFYVGSGGSTATNTAHATGGGMYLTTTAIDGLYAFGNSGSPTMTCTVKLYRRARAV